MDAGFVIMNMTRQELVDLHRALLAHFEVENTLRQEQGLEPAAWPPLLARMEKILAISQEQAHEIFHQVDDELWAYSWFGFTDEWARYRAHRDVEATLGQENQRMRAERIEQLVEEQYRKNFDKYVKEIDMSTPLFKKHQP